MEDLVDKKIKISSRFNLILPVRFYQDPVQYDNISRSEIQLFSAYRYELYNLVPNSLFFFFFFKFFELLPVRNPYSHLLILYAKFFDLEFLQCLMHIP